MESENFLEKMVAMFSQSASVKSVFGDPITVGNKVIIPVAEVVFGLGGGAGSGGRPRPGASAAHSSESPLPEAPAKNYTGGEGAGGGGGLVAKPIGVYEVTPTAIRFVPVRNPRPLLLGAAAGFLLGALVFKGSKRPK